MEKRNHSESVCRVAIIGAGYMAREHIRAFQDIPDVELVGIYSRTRPRAEALAKEFNISLVCNSVAELYEKTAANLVIVTVSILATREACSACFEYPWTLLIEKPVGYNLAEAEVIAQEAHDKRRRAYVALNRRHYAVTRAVMFDLEGQSGPRLIKVQDQQSLDVATQIGHPQAVMENWFHACSIHLIDYFLLFGRGAITEVEHIVRWNYKQPHYVAAKISFESGDIGLYEAIWNGPGPWAVTVNTPVKRWELRPLESAFYQLAGKRVLEPISDDTIEARTIDTRYKAGIYRQAELAVLESRGLQTGLPTLDDALATMRLTQAIYS